jgi:hypothetical protein
MHDRGQEILPNPTSGADWPLHCDNAANGARLFFENVWHFKGIREIEAFLN